jgi:hypothetical protein
MAKVAIPLAYRWIPISLKYRRQTSPIKPGADAHSVIRRMSLLVVFGVWLFGVGCKDVATTFSAEARSPDGHWLATARSQQCGGPGTAYDATSVFLQPADGSKPPTQVLGFSHEYATMNLKMEWITSKHLNVTYGPSAKPGDHVSLDFQVVKCGGIEISVRSLPGETTNTSR